MHELHLMFGIGCGRGKHRHHQTHRHLNGGHCERKKKATETITDVKVLSEIGQTVGYCSLTMIRQKWQFTILIWGRRVGFAADLRPALAVWRLKIIFQINGVSILTRADGCHLLQTISLGLVFARQQSSCTQFIREHRKIQFHFVFRIRLAPQRGQLAQERSTSNSRKLTNGWLVNACHPIELDMAHSYFPIVVIRCNDGGNIPNAMLAFSSLTTRIAIYDLRPAPKSFHSFHSFLFFSLDFRVFIRSFVRIFASSSWACVPQNDEQKKGHYLGFGSGLTSTSFHFNKCIS